MIYGYIIKYFVYQKTDSAKLLYGILSNFAMSKMLFFVKIKFAIEKALDKKRNMIKLQQKEKIMDLVIGIIFDVIATAALVYLFIFGYNSEYEAATIIAPVLIYIIWSRRAQMIKTRKWRESIEKQMKNKDEKES